MNTEWSLFLGRKGARAENGILINFGDATAELQAVASSATMADMSSLGVLFFGGDDAGSFLQGQLSCDVLKLGVNDSVYGSYCSPKGRALATFLIWRSDKGYGLLMPRELLPAIQKRLSMFVLRSKVTVEDVSGRLVRIGLADPRGGTALARLLPVMPSVDHHGEDADGGLLIRLSAAHWLWVGDAPAGTQFWERASAEFRAVGTSAWPWLDIQAGVPWVTQATQDQFVPQMINLELIGGVSFQKGCYTGQEIVARTQYLGKLKRRMYLANVAGADAPGAGTTLYSDDLGDQASGMVVNAHASPRGGVDMLVVAHAASVASSVVHLAALDGPALSFLPLPYALP